MKAIINGKKYDTETAEFMASDSANCPCNDFAYWEESLYKKKTGEFFLMGKGGGLSKYAKSCGQNSWTGSKAITPLTLEEAKEWVENHANSEFEDIFGMVEE